MEHSKMFLGVMLCAFVQQPQRNKNVTPNMYIWKVVLTTPVRRVSYVFVPFQEFYRVACTRVQKFNIVFGFSKYDYIRSPIFVR